MAVFQPRLSTESFTESDEVAIEMLYACHDRVDRQCETLSRLVPHLAEHGSDKAAQQASLAVLRYFNQAAPHHHADEEHDLFPALLESTSLGLSSEIPALIQRLLQDHRTLERLWAELSADLTRIAQGQLVVLNPEVLALFLKTYQEHIDLENNVLFPMIKRSLSEAQIAAIGRSMRLRRGIDSVR